MDDSPEVGLRIGELARRAGVSPDVLRAWERRYGLLSPRRSSSGQRLYSVADERRVARMRASMADGYSAQVAARMALAEEPGAAPAAAADGTPDAMPRPDAGEGVGVAGDGASATSEIGSLGALAGELREALYGFHDAAANRVIDRILAAYGVETLVCDVVLPLQREVGIRWARDELTVAQEHFTSALLIGRLRALARGWDQGSGPRALVGCPAGEAHDIGLLCFSLLLRQRGYRISYLGASVPSDSLFDAAERLKPDLVVIAGVREEPFWDAYEGLAELAGAYRLMIGGAGASRALGEHLGVAVLPRDPARAADVIVAASA